MRAQQGSKQLVLRLIGKVWRLDYGQHRLTTAAEFLAFDQPDFAKLTVGFQLKQLGDELSNIGVVRRFLFCIPRGTGPSEPVVSDIPAAQLN